MNRTLVYNLGVFNYKGNKIEFYYPSNFVWSCIECGNCCRDSPTRNRSILLTKSDIEKINKLKKNFFDEKNDPPFIGILKMEGGECVFLKNDRCRIYENRALICRTYPFWIEKHDDILVLRPDVNCLGIGKGEILVEEFFKKLIKDVINHTHYT